MLLTAESCIGFENLTLAQYEGLLVLGSYYFDDVQIFMQHHHLELCSPSKRRVQSYEFLEQFSLKPQDG